MLVAFWDGPLALATVSVTEKLWFDPPPGWTKV
jgi:hypothetical protein